MQLLLSYILFYEFRIYFGVESPFLSFIPCIDFSERKSAW